MTKNILPKLIIPRNTNKTNINMEKFNRIEETMNKIREQEEKGYKETYWVAVDGNDYDLPLEKMFHNKPKRAPSGMEAWVDPKTSSAIPNNYSMRDYSVILPKGTIEKMIGRKLTWEDEPVEIVIDLDNY